MMPWHDERMDGAASDRVASLVFDVPRGTTTGRRKPDAGPDAAAVRDDRGHEDRDQAAQTIFQIARSHVMKSLFNVIAVAAVSLTLGAGVAQAQGSPWEVAVLGGVNAYSQNDTAIPDNLWGVPLVGGASYHFNEYLAADGEFTWFIPVKQDVDMGAAGTQKRKAPDALAYQLGLRALLPLTNWSPYVAAGAGAMTFLSATGSDHVPQLNDTQTVFALNFGAGATAPLNAHWGLRAEFREFVGFPSDNTSGLSTNGNADAIWLSRGSVGVNYRF